MDDNENFQFLAKAKREADDYPAHPFLSITQIERFRFVWWMLWGIVSTIVVVAITGTIFVIGVKNDFSLVRRDHTELEKKVAANGAKIDGFDARFRTDDVLHLAHTNRVDSMQKELDDRRYLTGEVQEMWFMKDHGIDNSADFLQKHGYRAPSDTRVTPSPH